MPIRHRICASLSAFTVLLFLPVAVPFGKPALLAAEPDPAPVPATAESVDPDVLRKVRKLVKGTLSEIEGERETAWKGLKDMGNLAVPGLLGLYHQKETTPEMVRSILIAFGDSKDMRAGPALVEMLESKEPSIRRDAARSLGESGYPAGRKALEKVAGNEKEDEEVRLFAAVAAAKLGGESGLAVLAALLKSAKPEIRSRAVFGLGKHGGVAQVPVIESALGDSERDVREDAIGALRALGKKECWGPLVKATADNDYKIRSAAMDALQELTKAHVDNTPKAWQEWWAKQGDSGKQ